MLAIAGVTLTWGDTEFTALVRHLEASPEAYHLTPGSNIQTGVRCLKSLFPSASPRTGDHFDHAEGYQLRILRIREQPGHPLLEFECEVSPAL